MAKGVFVIAELRDQEFRKVSFEAVSEARRIAESRGGNVTAAVIGNGIADIAEKLFTYGADRVLVADKEELGDYLSDTYSEICAGMIQQTEPDLVLLGASMQGKDLAARLSARLDAGVAMDCVKIEAKEDDFVFTRPMYGGKVLAEVRIAGSPKIAAIRPNVMAIEEAAREGTVENLDAVPGEAASRVVEKRLEAGDRIELTEADVVVSGGRGTGGDFSAIESLADLLGGAVGASRSAVDEGWRPHSDQVGQTGKTVSPALYIACGISGAIQHLAGMSTSKYIVAINKDPEAPIFTKSDFGVVGDIFEVLPAVIDEVKKIKS